MLRVHDIAIRSALVAAKAANGTVKILQAGLVEQETAFTDRMLGRIEHAMEGFEANGVAWSAKTLTDKGRGAQEKKYGADFMGVLNVNLSGYQVRAGFLAQAKLIEPDQRVDKGEYRRMQRQCEDMLKWSAESFVFVYSTQGIVVIPAISVASADPCNLHEICSRSLLSFFHNHFESFIGDRILDGPAFILSDGSGQEFYIRTTLTLTARWTTATADPEVKSTTA